MKYLILLSFLILTGISMAGERISKIEAIEIAKHALKPELQAKYTRITLVEWKEHVESWMIAFEHPDKNIEEGYWVLLDKYGDVVDAGKVYADH